MDFDKLLAKANSNVKKLNKKVYEADAEVEEKRRRQLERLSQQHIREKMELKRKAPPRPQPPPVEKKQEFVIPKKKKKDAQPDVDKEKLAAFLQRREEEKQREETRKKLEKEELIRKRIAANGGKATKKIAKVIGASALDLQLKYAPNSSHAEELMKRDQRAQEEHDKLSSVYRQGVYNALNKRGDTRGERAPAKANSTYLDKPQSSSSGSSKKASTLGQKPQQSEAIKRPSAAAKPPAEDFHTLMQKAAQNRDTFVEPEEFFDEPPAPVPAKKPRPAQEGIGLTAGRELTYAATIAARKEKERQEEQRRREEIQKWKEAQQRQQAAIAEKKALMQQQLAERAAAEAARFNKPLGVLSQSQKEKLLAAKRQNQEMRVQQQPAKSAAKVNGNSISATSTPNRRPAAEKPSLNGIRKEQQAPQQQPPAPPMTARQREQWAMIQRGMSRSVPDLPPTKSLLTNSKPKTSLPAQQQQKHGAPVDKTNNKASATTSGNSKQQDAAAALARKERERQEELRRKIEHHKQMKAQQQQRELAALAERKAQQKQQQQQMLKSAGPSSADRINKPQPNRHSAPLPQHSSKFSRPQHDSRRDRPQQQQRQKPFAQKLFKKAYANYSETEDDEEDEDEGADPYEDDYDSDLADFIDDSNLDEFVREDFDEALKQINPHYDKKKWKMREMMIDDRKMTARFRDVEAEERRSAKFGLVEDLIEARRGSKALA